MDYAYIVCEQQETIMEDWSTGQTVTTMGIEGGIVHKPPKIIIQMPMVVRGISNVNDCRYTTIYFSKC